MAWTRREFLSRTTVLGAAVTVGCSSRVGGTPRPDPAARSASAPPSSSRTAPQQRTTVLGILAYRPYTIEEGDEVTGPVPEVARAVLRMLDITEVEMVTVRDEAVLLTGIAAAEFDLVGGLTIRPDLCGGMSFSIPDYVSGTALLVPPGNPKGLRTYAEVVATRARLAVMTGLPEQEDAAAAGVPAGQILPVELPEELIAVVGEGQADCAAFDDISARELAKNSDGAVTIAEAFLPAGRLPLVGGYAFSPISTDLLEPFNEALGELHDSGEWLRIVEPFGFTEQNVPPADLTTEQACAGG